MESTGHLREHPFYMPVRVCSSVLQWALRCGRGNRRGGRWRYEFFPSENLGSGIHLVVRGTGPWGGHNAVVKK